MQKVVKKSRKQSEVKESKKYSSMIEAYGAFWRRGYKEWAGTSSRSEYWWAFLMNLLVSIFWMFLIVVSGFPIDVGIGIEAWSPISMILSIGFLIFAFAVLVPSISMNVRRLHDIGLSAWWLLLWLLSPICETFNIIVSIIFFVFAVLPTKVEGNPYHKFNK